MLRKCSSAQMEYLQSNWIEEIFKNQIMFQNFRELFIKPNNEFIKHWFFHIFLFENMRYMSTFISSIFSFKDKFNVYLMVIFEYFLSKTYLFGIYELMNFKFASNQFLILYINLMYYRLILLS
jgi:hypothetical protein